MKGFYEQPEQKMLLPELNIISALGPVWVESSNPNLVEYSWTGSSKARKEEEEIELERWREGRRELAWQDDRDEMRDDMRWKSERECLLQIAFTPASSIISLHEQPSQKLLFALDLKDEKFICMNSINTHITHKTSSSSSSSSS